MVYFEFIPETVKWWNTAQKHTQIDIVATIHVWVFDYSLNCVNYSSRRSSGVSLSFAEITHGSNKIENSWLSSRFVIVE